MRRSFSAVFSAFLALALGVSLEWILLTGSSPQAVYKASIPPTPTPAIGSLPADFQTGVVFPQWGVTAYSATNENFTYGLQEIHDQTGARWVELTITLYQKDFNTNHLDPSEQTVSPESLAEGIRIAHQRGYKVFVAPLLTVGATGWAGDIHYRRLRDTSAWFENYFQTLLPYLQVATREHAEQFALGTEYEALEAAPSDLWNTLIDQARAIYPGKLTYDMNWTAALKQPRDWMVRNHNLDFLGVSVYRPLTTRPAPRDADGLTALWQYKIGDMLDALALASGKDIVLSEIGYRNSADALYQPWQWKSSAPADPDLQAAAYEAALQNIIRDPYVAGAFFWGWSVPAFAPNWLPAAQTLHRWYTLPLDKGLSGKGGDLRLSPAW
jgi:glycosyl hydrolase family 113